MNKKYKEFPVEIRVPRPVANLLLEVIASINSFSRPIEKAVCEMLIADVQDALDEQTKTVERFDLVMAKVKESGNTNVCDMMTEEAINAGVYDRIDSGCMIPESDLDEEWMNAPMGTPKESKTSTITGQTQVQIEPETITLGELANKIGITDLQTPATGLIGRPPKPEHGEFDIVYWRPSDQRWIVEPPPKTPDYKHWAAVAMIADGSDASEVIESCNISKGKYASLCRTERVWIAELKAIPPGQGRWEYLQTMYRDHLGVTK